jgi:hypothetical protein
VSPFKLGLTPGHGQQRVSKPNPQLVRHGPSFFTPKPSPVRKLTIHTSLWHARKHKDGVNYLPTLFSFVIHDLCHLYITCAFLGESITIPAGREIDGTYLNSNEADIKK